MRFLRVLLILGVAFFYLPGRTLGMGSGPHPTVPYGLPAPSSHAEASTAESHSIMPMVWVAASVVVSGILLFAIQPYLKKP